MNAAEEREAEFLSVPTDNGQPLAEEFKGLDVVALFAAHFGPARSSRKLIWRVKASATMTDRTCSACRTNGRPRAWLSGTHEGFASAKAKTAEASSSFGISLCRPCSTPEGIGRGLKNRVEDFKEVRAAKHDVHETTDERTPMPHLQTSAISLEQIRESPHNHRKHFDESALQELVDSVKAHGVLQPVLVRPAPPPVGGKVKYELVYGHRRFRAARLAKLKEIPATVRELDDKAALEVGLVENLRRADVLPMEEAEGYRELHEKHQVSVEQLAERVGKSKEYVYGRLKLCDLKAPAVRQALDAGRVSPSTALLIARIPGEKLQEAAAKKILEGGAYDYESNKAQPMSHRRAAELVQDEFMLQLSKAPFNTKDAKLLPDAGACGPCPKRTGNCKALYPDVKAENVCTDPACFGQKKAAAFKLEQEAAKAKGQTLLKESKKIWDWTGKELDPRGKYVELTATCPGDKKKRTFKELLGDKAQVLLARDLNGKMHQLLEKDGLAKSLKEAGHSIKLKEKEERGGAIDYAQHQREDEFRERVVRRLLAAVFNKVFSGKVGEQQLLRFIAMEMWRSGAGFETQQRWTSYIASGTDVAEFITKASSSVLLGLVVEDFLAEGMASVWNGYSPLVKEVCTTLGMELKDLEKEQKEADAAQPAAPKKELGPEAGPDEGEEEAD